MPFISVGGQWKIKQSNGFTVDVNIQQHENRLDAFCSHSGNRVQSREAKGFVENENFELTITWTDGKQGRYNAKLEQTPFATGDIGVLKGSTVDITNPTATAGWESDRTFRRL